MTGINQLNQTISRRNVIRFLAGVPALPLATGSVATLLTGCGSDNNSNGFLNPTLTPSSDYNSASKVLGNLSANTVTSVDFVGMPAPTTVADMAKTTVNSKLQAKMQDGSTKTYNLVYTKIFNTGETVKNAKGGTIISGGYFDINGNPIMDTSAGTSRQFFSDCPDGTSLLTVPNASVSGVKNPVFAVVQFEYTTKNLKGDSMYGKLPSPIAVLTFDQDPTTGALTFVQYANVDTSPAKGLWITCGASLSPWGTHLSSEEYEPNGLITINGNTSDAQFAAFSKNTFGSETAANPYDYGHLPEITVNKDGTGTCKKHYCLGRLSHELIQVMPDQRTCLMGNDATNAGIFMFVADKAADLSSGTLYAAKMTQTSAGGNQLGDFKVEWIKLGSATSLEIQSMVRNNIKLSDFMDVQTKDPADNTYTKIMYNGAANWVKMKSDSATAHKAAAFLETQRYAALKGASMAFTKNEGTTVNMDDKKAYSAISYQYKSMVGGHKTNIASYGVNVGVLNAGGTYTHDLTGGQKDTAGNAINSDWVSSRMYLTSDLAGQDLATPDALGNTANQDKIANPDNLKYSKAFKTLFIGEDSGMHINNFLWAYNTQTKSLARILSTPAGAESTGLHAIDEINGFTYIMSNFQHPGDELISTDPTKPTNYQKAMGSAKVQQLVDAVNENYSNGYSGGVGYLAFKA
nr:MULTISPECIES: alkaline phosphatase PhoX [unclassified Moraxella]